ncbi:MAG: hypothetical protein ACU0CC_21320 [Sagittula sp.]|jgi:hypothetical protein|uniref:hypothetical protein n=1 Tax=unclassified Sagittula TaxID=2624628 RepID=UPI000C2D2A33|nr:MULTISPECIES: hypothetical protein [unclassified Sagittula]AUC54228.1 hypothetical protein CDO87_14050 [Sagittula sp. P11]WHZ34397.1 hypothetical protein QNI11_17400 [Sagittula sp. MA-2]
MNRLSLSLICCIGLLALATLGADPLPAETVRVKPVDFDLPLGIADGLPAGVPLSEVFVTDDLCFYYRQDGKFHFLDCVG